MRREFVPARVSRELGTLAPGSLEQVLRLGATAALARRKRKPERIYWEDPVAWLHDRVRFEDGEAPTAYQEECLDALARHHRASPRGPHGLGKSAMASWGTLWFVDTRDRARADWKAIATAGSWAQLRNYYWPEVHKWARRVKGLDWREGSELLQMSIKLATGQAFSVASNKPELIEGAHADELLFIYDEAKSIPATTYDATEGAFSGAGKSTGRNAYAWAGSTPGAAIGRFSDIHHRKPGYEDWWVRHVTLDESIAAGRIDPDWVEQRAKQWGRDSAVFINRVLGNFAAEDAEAVVPLAWLEAANMRWLDLDGGYAAFTNVGVDVARFGDDVSIIAERFGDAIASLHEYSREATTAVTGHVRGILDREGKRDAEAVVDVIGMGAGVVDQLREMGYTVRAFNAAGRSQYLDRSGELGYANRRSAAWWNLREMLDPTFEPTLALPPDDMLTGDLTSPKWRVTSGGKIQVESKDDIRKRIDRSTDRGDAVVMAFSLPEPDDYEGTVWYDEPVDIGGGY